MPSESLAAAYAEKIAVPRCRPRCDPRDWTDLPASGGTIKTICGKCATWIGNRPAAASKQKANLTTESTEETE